MDEQEKEVIEDMLGEQETAQDAEPVGNDVIQEIVAKIRELVKRGNVAKIQIIKGDNVLVNLPLNVGIVGGLIGVAAAPWALIAAAIATAGFDCRVELIKDSGEVVDLSPKTLGKKVVDAGATVVDEVRGVVDGIRSDGEGDDDPGREVPVDEEIPFDEKPDDQ